MKRIFTLLGIALCALYMFATPVTIRPGLTLEPITNGYHIHFAMPDYWEIQDTITVLPSSSPLPNTDLTHCPGEYYYSRIQTAFDGEWDLLSEDGRPELPFYSIYLVLPYDVASYDVEYEEILSTETLTLGEDYIPAQIRSNYYGGLSYDNNYYSSYNDTWYWNNYTIDDNPYRRVNGLVFSFFPVHYEPSSREVTIATEADFIIHYEGTDIDNNYLYELLNDEYSIRYYYDNFVDFPSVHPAINDSYLIITEDQYENDPALEEFVHHKISLGYHVDVVPIHDIGSSPDDIRDYIKSRYENENTKFVLLVGNLADIPFYDGEEDNTSDPASDIYYTCLSRNHISDQYRDFSPSVFLGRWPVATSSELAIVVDKTIASDISLGEILTNYGHRAAIFSGSNHSGCVEKTYYGICDYINDKLSDQQLFTYNGIIVDGRDPSVDFDTMRSILGGVDDCFTWMFIYAGKANQLEIEMPYHWAHSHIDAIVNDTDVHQPFGFAFADQLCNLYNLNNFAKAWLVNRYGGSTFFGATTETYHNPDKYFSRMVFAPLNKKPAITIGELVGNAKAKYYNSCKVVWRRREAKKYVLLGDPSLYVFGLDIYNNIPYELNQRTFYTGKGNELDMDFEHVDYIQIYSAIGQLIRTCNSEKPDVTGLPSGIYTAVLHSGYKQQSIKIILQ